MYTRSGSLNKKFIQIPSIESNYHCRIYLVFYFMENNILNKEKFISQYWGQKVGATNYTSKMKVGKSNISNIRFLELKPISSITDEDVIEVAKRQISINEFAYSDYNDYLQDCITEGKKIIQQYLDGDEWFLYTETTDLYALKVMLLSGMVYR